MGRPSYVIVFRFFAKFLAIIAGIVTVYGFFIEYSGASQTKAMVMTQAVAFFIVIAVALYFIFDTKRTSDKTLRIIASRFHSFAAYSGQNCH